MTTCLYISFGLVTKSINAVSQSQQTLIDISSFHQSQSSIICIGSSFRPSKINERQFGNIDFCIDPMGLVFMLNSNLQHCMRTRGCLIGVCSLLGPHSVALEDVLHDLFWICGHDLHNSSNANTLDSIFTQL